MYKKNKGGIKMGLAQLTRQDISKTFNQKYYPSKSPLDIETIRNRTKVLNAFKKKTYEKGKEMLFIRPTDIPEHIAGGGYVELAMMAILGRIEEFFKKFYGLNFELEFDYVGDLNNWDIKLCHTKIDFKSCYFMEKECEKDYKISGQILNVQLIYDLPGMYNLIKTLLAVDKVHYMPDELISDVNYLWEIYMSFSTLRFNRNPRISYKNIMGAALDNMDVYKSEFDAKTLKRLEEEKAEYEKKIKDIEDHDDELVPNKIIDIDNTSMITVEEFMKMLGTNNRTQVYKIIHTDTYIQKTKVGKKYYINRKSAEDFCKTRESEQKSTQFNSIGDILIYNLTQASYVTGYPKQLLEKLIINKKLRAFNLGGELRIPKKAINEYIDLELNSMTEDTLDSNNSKIIINSREDDLYKELKSIFEKYELTLDNVFTKINYSMFSEGDDNLLIQFDDNLKTIISLVYPELNNRLHSIHFDKKTKEFSLINYKDEVISMFPSEKKFAENVTYEWTESTYFKGVLTLKQFEGSLYKFAKTIYPNIGKWDIKNLRKEEFTTDEIGVKVRELINDIGATLRNFKMFNKDTLQDEPIAQDLLRIMNKEELIDFIKKELR